MDKQKINIKKALEKMKPADYVYIGVLFLFFIIVVIVFSISTSFIAKSINKIFSPVSTENPQSLNIEQYNLTIKKLNLPAAVPSNNPSDSSQTVPQAQNPTPQTLPTTSPDQKTLDIKSLTINILNSTTKNGVASILNKALVSAGFSSATTGNEKQPIALTTITIKEAKKDYIPLIQDAVKKLYPKAIVQTSSTKTDFDVTIIIGKE